MFQNGTGKRIYIIINNNTVSIFETSNLWVIKLRPKLNESGEFETQKISMAVTW